MASAFQNSDYSAPVSVAPTSYRTAGAEQAAQPMDGPARRWACHMLGEFFSQPLLDGKPKLQLVVNNDQML
jgi:hypothetical protein